MLALLFAVLSLVQVVDASTGRSLPIPVSVSDSSGPNANSTVAADGSALHYASFHGVFAWGTLPRVIRLTALTADERQAIARVNTFRKQFGMAPLDVDENLMETARYWSQQERATGRIGHTCAEIGAPSSCVEFNAYFHRLPGAPPDWFSGQNAAFDTYSSWLAPEAGFERERQASTGERGHFLNLVGASRWIGLGETRIPGYGAFFAMNLI